MTRACRTGLSEEGDRLAPDPFTDEPRGAENSGVVFYLEASIGNSSGKLWEYKKVS